MSIPTTRAERTAVEKAARWADARKWAYGVCIAAVPVAVYFGWLPPEASPVILPLILAILNVQKPASV